MENILHLAVVIIVSNVFYVSVKLMLMLFFRVKNGILVVVVAVVLVVVVRMFFTVCWYCSSCWFFEIFRGFRCCCLFSVGLENILRNYCCCWSQSWKDFWTLLLL